MPTSPRKRIETILLAILAIVSVLPLRFFVESRFWFLAEMGTLAFLFCVAEVAKTFGHETRKPKRLASSATVALATTPIAFAVFARMFGSPIAFEMSGLSTFGAMSLAIAMAATSERNQAMSLVASGFLVLFATSISDDTRAVWVAVLWMSGCVWHLVANHWEKLDVCLAESVRPAVGIRPASVLAATVLCIIGGLVVRDRFGGSNRMAFGFMPTSGGSKWSDSAARSGIGTGDAAIAAKDHAESFGAVESEIFLESTESTLFDMANDMFGEPKKKNKWERRQAMGSDNVIPMHERASKSEQGGSSFSIDRMQPKKHHHFDDATSDAVLQWDGPTGIRLAMERYDAFDGVDWTNSADHSIEELNQQEIDQHVWFFDPKLQSKAISDSDSVSVNLLKVLRLDSTRFPSPMMTAGLHIKDVNRQDFFGIKNDGSLFMPGREKIPQLTVVNLASINVMEDELVELKSDPASGQRRSGFFDFTRPRGESASQGRSGHTQPSPAATASDLPASGSVNGDARSPYEQLQSIVNYLRTEFTFDRSSENTVDGFLKTRRGGDHLFATVAALKAREIGLQSRLVTGFYVRPDSFEISAGHANITPNDVHAWVEIKLDDGRWFEIEPTPGYQQPVYTPSWWLVRKRFAAAHWIHGLLALAICGLLYRTRLVWAEWLLGGIWSLSRWLRPKYQIGLAMRIVETRARLLGSARPQGKPQRDWLESLVNRDVQLQDHVKQFCDVADQAIFGGSGPIDRRRLSSVVRKLNTKQLKLATREATA
ncbi:transglutaminase-like domain-containing protein [Novipirellula artificiosorum]|uniref:Transglutaminase-like superfamily protein n=1 Tax=Novipirellula artificiosorum TaxID=2528016 RepID=A0A5C6D2Q6_9BACT|nr:transglutaminase-like domain-containing protein [Novipirellula artificiosorum]TWU31120.1 Transglutaminase-like superfamily protein [Novipirellula artificiosorum]